MDIPEPSDPHGFWEAIKEKVNPWPQDSESAVYALADAMDAAARVVERAQTGVNAVAGQLPGVWPDPAGTQFAEILLSLDTQHADLVLILRELATLARDYGLQIVEAKNAILVEIGLNAALYGLLAPTGLGALLVARVAGRLISMIAAKTAALASRGIPAAAGKVLGNAAQGAVEEVSIEAITQGISMSTGHRDAFDGRQLAVAALAGAGGEMAGDAVRRLGVGSATDDIGRGLEQLGVTQPIARNTTAALQQATTTGLTSPSAGYAADRVLDGDLAGALDLRGHAQALQEGGLKAAVLGGALGSSTDSVRQSVELMGGNGSPSPQRTGGADLALAKTDGPPPPHQPAAPPANQSAAPPAGQSAPPAHQSAAPAAGQSAPPPAGQSAPPTSQSATPPVTDGGPPTDAGPGGQGTGQHQTGPPAGGPAVDFSPLTAAESGTGSPPSGEAAHHPLATTTPPDGTADSPPAQQMTADNPTASPGTPTTGTTGSTNGPATTPAGGAPLSVATPTGPIAITPAAPIGAAPPVAGGPIGPIAANPGAPTTPVSASTPAARPDAARDDADAEVDTAQEATDSEPAESNPDTVATRPVAAGPVAGGALAATAPAPTHVPPVDLPPAPPTPTHTRLSGAPVPARPDPTPDTGPPADGHERSDRQDPETGLVPSATLDGQDPRGVLVGALAASVFSGGDIRTELIRRLPGARFTPLSATDLAPVLDMLRRATPGATAYLLITDATGAQRSYALLDQSRDGRRVVVGYDPQTGREAPIAPGAVPIEDFVSARSPIRTEVMILDGSPRAEQPVLFIQSGGSIRPRDVLDMTAQELWASKAYDLFRSDPADVADIARNLEQTPRDDGSVGFSPAEIQRVKEHLFVDEHLLNVYDDNGDVVGHRMGRFDADADIAEAWIRLRCGEPLPEDVLLLEHELRELHYADQHPEATYAEAHAHANERFDWERSIPERTGEDLDGWGHQDGDTATLPQGGGDRTGGALPVRVSGVGPQIDDQQAGPDVAGGRPAGRPRVPGGGQADSGAGGRGEGVAAGGRDPVLETAPERTDNSQTATELAGATARHGRPDPQRVFRDLMRALGKYVEPDRGSPVPDPVELTAILRLEGTLLRFRVGTPREGTRAHREEVVVNGQPAVEVVVSDSPPVDEEAGRRWVDRIVGHELAEHAAVRPAGRVARAKAKLRSLGGMPAHPDALRRGAEPSLTRLSPHDEGHKAEVKILLKVLKQASATPKAAQDVEVELGLLLDHLGIGRPDPHDPVALSEDRLALLALSPDELATIRPLLAGDAGWRSDERRVAHLARTGEVAAIALADGTPISVRFSRSNDEGGTSFTVEPPQPLSTSDGLPARDPSGNVLLGPAEIVFGRRADVTELVRQGLVDRVRARLEPPTFVPWRARANTPGELTSLSDAYSAAKTDIEAGLPNVGAELIGGFTTNEHHVVRVRTDGGRLLDVELAFGALPKGEATRVEVGTRQFRVVLAENTNQLKAMVAEAVVRAVETARHHGGNKTRHVDEGLLAAAEQAQLMGERDRVVANLADAGLLSDQPRSRRRVKRLPTWLDRAAPAIASRMFDTISQPNADGRVLQVLDWALDTAVSDFSPGVRGARIHGPDVPVVWVRIGDSVNPVPVKIITSAQRDFAVRLQYVPDAPSVAVLEVRADASEAALLVEAAAALAKYAVLASRIAPGREVDATSKRLADSAARSAQVEVLTSLYRAATPAERLMIERYAQDRVQGPLNPVNRLRDGAEGGRVRLNEPLVGRVGRKLYGPPMFRRLVSSAGSAGNTFIVGVEFNRDPLGMATSMLAGLLGSTFQAAADGAFGSPLASHSLLTDPDKSLVREAHKPPDRETGDPIQRNLVKYTPAAATTAAVQVIGGSDLEKTSAGAWITLVASLLQAVADKAAEPYEFDATRKRGVLEEQEPDTVRNTWAENVFHRVRKLYDDPSLESGLDQKLNDELTRALKPIEQAIKKSEAEVRDKVGALQRRRGILPQPAKNLWNRTGGRVSDSWKFASAPDLTYELLHLPQARAAFLVNPLRVAAQQSLMQVPSLYLGFAGNPELHIANILMQAGRGFEYGEGWTRLSAWQADDKTAAAAARALFQLRESKAMIEEMLAGQRDRASHPDPPSGPFAIFRQVQQDRAATVIEGSGQDELIGVPQDESFRLQSDKHIRGFIGGLAVAYVPVWAVGIPDGEEIIWLVGQAAYTALYLVGEGVQRTAEPIIKRIDRDAQLRAEADRLPFPPLQIAQDVTRMAENAAEAAEKIQPMRVPDDDQASLASRFARGVVRAGLGAWRLIPAGTGLRPGDNPPGPVLLDRRDAVAVNEMVKHARYLDRVAAMERDGQRTPVGLDSTMLRAHLRVGMQHLGLLAEQAGSAARWEAVVEDAKLRFGVDLNAQTELAELRTRFDQWPDAAKKDRVERQVRKVIQDDEVGHGVVRALDVMARRGWSNADPTLPDGRRELRLAPGGKVRIITDHGGFKLEVRSRDNGADGGPAMLEPQRKGPHHLYVHPAVLADPEQLARVLDCAVDAWFAGRGPGRAAGPDFGGVAALVFRGPMQANPGTR